MNTLAKLTAIALIGLTAATTASSAMVIPTWPPVNTPSGPQGSQDLTCSAHGHDFFIMNFGTRDIDSGRPVAWRSPTTGDEDVIMLPVQLAPGEQIKLAGVLTEEARRGAPCNVAFA